MNIRMKVVIITIGMLVSSIGINAQSKIPKPPKLPQLPKFENEFGNFFKMNAEEEKKALSKLDVLTREQLRIIKQNDTNKYYRLLRESQFKNMNFPFLSKEKKEEHNREQEIFKLEIATEALAAKHQNAKSQNEKRILKSKLEKTLSKLFDLKEESRKKEVKELEEELRKLKKSLNIRMQNKDEIVKRRLLELLNEDDYLEWE